MRAAPIAGLLTAALTLLGTGARADAAGHSPKVNYMLNCQGCHLPDGRGMTGKVPDMRGMLGKFLQVEGGRDFLVRVPGTANSTLSDDDIAALLNWLVLEMGPKTASPPVPYSASEVGGLRARRLQDVKTERQALMQKIDRLTSPALATTAPKN